MSTTNRDSLDDGDCLASLFTGAPTETRPAPVLPADYTPAVERAFSEPCAKCGGTGSWSPGRIGYSYNGGGSNIVRKCFGCDGTGKKTFKTSPQQRSANRERANERKQEQAAERGAALAAFIAEHKAEVEWLNETAQRQHSLKSQGKAVWEFPLSLGQSLAKYGSLTDGQLAAVRKFMVRDAERATQKAAERNSGVAEVDVAKIEAALTTAHENGKRKPFLLLDTFEFSRAPDSGKNPGAIYCKDGDQYLGKIKDGRFYCTRDCTDEQKARIQAAAADPAAAAIAYGKAFGRCSCCGLTLTNPESIELGIGPICREKYGF